MEIFEELKSIDENLIEELNKIALNKIEYWDVRCNISKGLSLDFTDQKSKEISSSETTDCGIRTFINGGWGFVVLKDFNQKSLKEGFSKAIKLARFTDSLSKNKFKIRERDSLLTNFEIDCKTKLIDTDVEEKIELIKFHEKVASNYSSQIKNTRTIYFDDISHEIFFNSFGSYITQELSMLRLFNMVYSQKNGLIQRAVNSVGGIGGFEIIQTEKARNLSQKKV